jgi:hypothetical protein
MSTREDQAGARHRHTPSNPQPSSFSSSQLPQSALPHVPRFALIHDIATGVRKYAPVTYLFADERHPHLAANEGKTRTLVVDLSGEGDKVVHAQSLSGEWQLVTAKIGTSARIASVDEEPSPGNTLLNIEGIGQFKPIIRSDDVFDLAKQFSER